MQLNLFETPWYSGNEMKVLKCLSCALVLNVVWLQANVWLNRSSNIFFGNSCAWKLLNPVFNFVSSFSMCSWTIYTGVQAASKKSFQLLSWSVTDSIKDSSSIGLLNFRNWSVSQPKDTLDTGKFFFYLCYTPCVCPSSQHSTPLLVRFGGLKSNWTTTMGRPVTARGPKCSWCCCRALLPIKEQNSWQSDKIC